MTARQKHHRDVDEVRYPLEPLAARSGLPRHQLAIRINASNLSMHRYERDGLTIWQADRFAVRLGFHPANVWPDWWHPTDGRNTRPLQPASSTRYMTTTSRETP